MSRKMTKFFLVLALLALSVAILVVFLSMLAKIEVVEKTEQLSKEELATQLGEDLTQLAEEVGQIGSEYEQKNDTQETNIERSKKAVLLQQLAQDKGLNIYCSGLYAEECIYFFERFLEVDEVIDTQGVSVLVGRRFEVFPRFMTVPYNAPMEEVLEFLRN